MSKREKQFYCKVGQAVCNIFGAILFFSMFIVPCIIGELIFRMF